MAGRVLIVDDEKEIGHILAKSLTKNGFKCDEADGFNTAREKLLACQYDVLLTDKNMPLEGAGNEGGLELIRWAHQNQPDLAILVMTGFPTLDSAVEALKLGAFDYLIKPLDLGMVQKKVARLCEYRKFVNPAAILNLYLDLSRQIIEAGGVETPDLEIQLKKMQELLDHLFFMLRTTERTLLEHRQLLAGIAAYAEQSCDELPQDNPARHFLQHVADEASHRI